MIKKKIKLLVIKIYDKLFSKIGNLAIDRYMETRFLFKYLLYGNEDRLQIAETAVINNATFNTISGDIKIGEYVFFGLNVSVLTGTHDYNKFGRERQITVPGFGRDVIIKEGAWLASNVTVIGPCIIGEHSVVAAGSLVNKDVEPYSIVAGIPARVVKKIDPPSHSDRTFSE
ncbi:MAG: acyltransferase [Oscillatoriales cyanobacterium]|uniref:Acyltransferase n=1 Tax=Microcoleus anatoxicus PTRS2 TaxID=2705321 RepID=A0ABU8YPV4_9CYAN|nr:MAG: acyltransferase [Oscillatoriales cyanobacterium]TAD94291.1 MAG: acyltransferase [Oscillatoriales cyanobacterium]TAE01761.1 MAG: acyltransferase [Oscillatoriales cyanobacterium]TAF06185.1 MAG: acyltransferase [Oscillatoriales cyanobacterium]TAF66067.1 MAG: acyltransferase [Oscillatoriales cyanobacterium]